MFAYTDTSISSPGYDCHSGILVLMENEQRFCCEDRRETAPLGFSGGNVSYYFFILFTHYIRTCLEYILWRYLVKRILTVQAALAAVQC